MRLNAGFRKSIQACVYWVLFVWDYFLCLVDDRHTAAPASYVRMRRLYSRTNGKSSHALSIPFQILHPPSKCNPATDISIISAAISKQGYCKLDPSAEITLAAEALHRRLSLCSVQEVLQGFEPGSLYPDLEAALKSGEHTAARLSHDRRDVCLMPETWELIRKLNLREVASAYLSCNPILTSVDSWHVVPLRVSSESNALYSAAAQTYHYDMDWIKFLKVFINLTAAPMESGPFEYVAFSHSKKNKEYYRDGRFDQLLDPTSEVIFASGGVGSCFFADTSGVHRDGRASTASRHVLQVEFAVSSFGSKFQYDEIYRHCREAVRPVKNLFPGSGRMFAVF